MNLTPSTAPDGLPQPAALDALAGVVERLAQGEPLDAAVPAALRTVQAALGSAEVAVWVLAPTGLERAWSVGEHLVTAPLLASVMERPDRSRDDLAVARLVASARRLGVLVAVTHRPLTSEERLCVEGVANALAPALLHAEQRGQLEVEVAARTRQIDEQRRFTERIIDSLPLGLYVIDRAYRIQAWNRKRETGMQGVSREDAIGRPIFDVLHRQPADLLRREFDEVFESGRIQSFEVESSATGELRTYRLSKIPMRVGGDDVTHVVTIGEDITEWRAAQDRVAQAEKLAAIGQLAAGAMHEINNPLATVAACAESLALHLQDLASAGIPVPASAQDCTKIIDSEVHRCKHIVDGLLDFSRTKQARTERVDVNEVVHKTLFLLKHHAGFRQVSVRTMLAPSLPVLAAGNTEQLVQVLMALLLNAMDAMSGRGIVTVRTLVGDDESNVVLEVADHGQGIPRSEFGRIFEPFYTTKPAGRGTGLGLAIAYGIVTEHGGRIDVDSTVGHGSTFRVTLPTAR